MKTQFLLSMAIVMVACSPTKTFVLQKYSKEIVFVDKTDEYFDNGNLKKCRLSDTAIIEGAKCVSWLHFFESGSVKQFQTANDIKQAAYVVPAGSIVFPEEHDISCFKGIRFSKDVNIDHIICKGGNEVEVDFYPNGRIKSCFLSANQTIQGFPCKSSLLKPIKFYPDGKIMVLTLSTDYEIQNNVYKNGETIQLGTDGTITKI
ncbi:MAG: hypothetical protein QM786_18830 [Breznakibacter sp.]